MKTVEIKYFAHLRDQARRQDEKLDVEAANYRELYQHLQQVHGFTLPVDMIQVAENEQFVSLDKEIENGARVVFIPPVAGG